jgi:hypothetical protein
MALTLICVDLNGILWKAWIGFSKISREGFFLLTFLRDFCKILREGFFYFNFPETGNFLKSFVRVFSKTLLEGFFLNPLLRGFLQFFAFF